MTLIDYLPRLGKITAAQAPALFAALFAEADALRLYDDRLFPTTDDPAAMKVAESLHAAWAEWAEQAAALREELDPLRGEGIYAAEFERLAYAIARTRAMLQTTPRRSLRSMEQLRRGEGVGLDEIRRHMQNRRPNLQAAGVNV